MSAYQSGTLKPCPGPDRHPKRPVFAMPPGACDTHVHVFGPQVEFPFSEQRSYTPEDCTYEDLMRLHATRRWGSIAPSSFTAARMAPTIGPRSRPSTEIPKSFAALP